MTSLHWAHPWAFLFGAGCLLVPAWRMVRARRLIAGADDYADKALRPWAVIARPLRQRWPRSIAEVLVWLLLATAMAGPRERLVQSLHGVMQSVHAVNIMVVLDTSAGMYLRRSPAPLAVEARSDLLTLQQLLRGERLGLVVYGRASGEIVPPTDDPALFDYYLDHVGPDLALTTWRPDVAAAIPRDSGLAGALYRNSIARLKSNRPPVDAQSSWYDLFTWPLIPALILMAVLAWPRRRNKAGHVAKLLVLALVVFLPTQAKAGARSDLRRAWQSWLAHDDRRAWARATASTGLVTISPRRCGRSRCCMTRESRSSPACCARIIAMRQMCLGKADDPEIHLSPADRDRIDGSTERTRHSRPALRDRCAASLARPSGNLAFAP
ncbi:hypothetical protein [Acidiphilium acidophilum]|uniref:hypothetical protein n=1 Tax=Acidiphilium acidophilum TaxID=76588 RepID=UPI002E8E7176|nr:hypothetical protein [Acidiphilium acidophilum]